MTASLLLAPSAHATPKGDNGTVKIHDSTTGEELRKNEPKVCSFYLDAFGFDAAQKVDWHIEAWANNTAPKGETVKSGSLTLDGSGHERTEDMVLPDGQYKLFWNFEGENGKAKHKVFKTDCATEDKPGEGKPEKPGKPDEKPGEEPGEEPGGKPGDEPGDKPGDEPGSKPGDEPGSKPGDEPGSKPGDKPGDEPAEEPSAEPTPAGDGEQPDSSASPAAPAPASPAPSGQGDASGDLAETGSGAPVGALAAAAAALVAAGGYLVMRRRKAQAQAQ
ncbi:LPXTG cell wall anchor domain-containing protein [Streptomyces enissocaesilis]|uniref:LPXTG cell wall anchor domain-containing protein n=1 Tax=Streptomyces enissocaesilis TaxID=332589 RepID=UPI0031D4FE28